MFILLQLPAGDRCNVISTNIRQQMALDACL